MAAHLRQLVVGRACRACRGSGWRRRACRCRAAGPARRRSRSSRRAAPSTSPIADRDAGRRPSEWRAVQGDLASTISANASATRSSRVVVGELDAVRGLEGADHRAARGRRASPRTRASRRASAARRRAPVEPAAAALARPRRRRRAAPPAAQKTSTVWARQRMRPSSGICSPAQAVRVAVAVPVLVERADRVGGRLGEPSMRAISAPRSQRISVSARPAPSARARAGGDRGEAGAPRRDVRAV